MITTPLPLEAEYSCLRTLNETWVKYGDQNWPSPEHALAAARCQTNPQAPQYWKEIWACGTPEKARRLSKRLPLRKDWPQVRDGILEQIMERVVENSPQIQQRLKDSGTRLLLNVEDTEFGCEVDEYTGEIRGKNRLGNLWMKLRTRL